MDVVYALKRLEQSLYMFGAYTNVKQEELSNSFMKILFEMLSLTSIMQEYNGRCLFSEEKRTNGVQIWSTKEASPQEALIKAGERNDLPCKL